MKSSRFSIHVVFPLSVVALFGPEPSAFSGDAPGADVATEKVLEGSRFVSVEVHPEAIELKHRFDYRQVLVSGRLETGELVDVTRMVQVESFSEAFEISRRGLVRPRADGAGELEFTLGAHSATVQVVVSGQTAERKVNFVQDVMPVLSRVGCNAGTCHGAAKGKNGFKLSLRGNDPLFDHRALTDDLAGRRFNRAAPDQSLFLLKTSGAVPHEGGLLVPRGTTYYDILRSWVADGVRFDPESPVVVGIELFPKNPTVPLPGMKQQFSVLATYSDGRVRDVSVEAFVETSDTEVTAVDKYGLVTALRRGEAAILARYQGGYAATRLFVMGDRRGFEWKEVPENNYIDTLVHEKLREIRTLPSALSTDAEFLRRVYLDLTGLPPTPKDVRMFLLDGRDTPVKRNEVIDRLIGSAEFVDNWTNKWADLLQVNQKFLGREGAEALRGWVRQAVASNMPYDRFVHLILTASGSTLKNPPASYYKILRKPDLIMENTTQLFLGIRFNCNKCHDHPFERWTQDNHWELAAFFAQVGRKNAPGSAIMPRRGAVEGNPPAFEEIIFDQDTGEMTVPDSGRTVAATFPYQHPGELTKEGSRREKLASWMTSPHNPYFARSYVNRVWSYFLGRGLIDPVDDVRAGNPPTHPELLNRLTEDFIASGFDTRELMRLICRSRVYQHSIETNEWNEDDQVNYSHALARRLSAETLYDAIHRATGSVSKLPGLRPRTRAAEVLDPSVKVPDGFLDLFGRPPRESACECERTTNVSLRHALQLVNGPTVAEAINDPANALAELVAYEKDPGKIVEELFVSFLCRLPAKAELDAVTAALDVRDMANTEALSPENFKELLARQATWEKKQKVVTWIPLEAELFKSAGGATLTRQDDGSILAGGVDPEKDTYTVVAWTSLTGITGMRLEALPHPSLKEKGPGRADKGNFVLSEIRLLAVPATDPAQVKPVVLQNATADFSQKDWPVAAAIDGKPDKGWAIHPQVGKRHRAVFETKEDVGVAGGTLLVFTLDQQHGSRHALGRFRIEVTTTERPVRVSNLPENIASILPLALDKRTPEQRAAVYRYYIATDPEMREKIRLSAVQDIAWALINSPAFLFNR